MAKKRPEVSPKIAVELQFASDRICCVCRSAGQDCQIHHLDENPGNNDPGNLALLCLKCHSDAGKTGGAGRTLTRELIVKYRDDWHALVRERRAVHRSELLSVSKNGPSNPVEDYITALAIHDVRNLHRNVFTGSEERDWDGAWDTLMKLSGYVAGSTEESDPRVKLEVMIAAEHIASYARDKMPANVAFTLRSVAGNALPGWNRAKKGNLTSVEVETYEYAAQIAHALVYEGEVYLEQFQIVEHGALLLWQILRDGVISKNDEVRTSAIRVFDWMLSDDRISPPNDAGKLLTLYRDQAIKDPQVQYPQLPDDLARKVVGPSR